MNRKVIKDMKKVDLIKDIEDNRTGAYYLPIYASGYIKQVKQYIRDRNLLENKNITYTTRTNYEKQYIIFVIHRAV